MQIKYPLLTGLVLVGVLATSCSTDTIPAPDSRELYTREFIKEFGAVSPDHDWNMATRKSVTVIPGASGRVQIYGMKTADKYGLVGDFENVESGTTLWFDIAQDTEDILVVSDGYGVTTKAGGSVDLTSRGRSRSIEPNEIATVDDCYTEWPIEVLKSYASIVDEDKDNTEKVTNNFSYISRGTFKFYPMFRYSDSRHVLGIYTIDPGTGAPIRTPLYSNIKGDELQYNTTVNITDNSLYIWHEGSECVNHHHITLIGEDGKRYYEKYDEIECSEERTLKPGDVCPNCQLKLTEENVASDGTHIYSGQSYECYKTTIPYANGEICAKTNKKVINSNGYGLHYHLSDSPTETECNDNPIWQIGDLAKESATSDETVTITGITTSEYGQQIPYYTGWRDERHDERISIDLDNAIATRAKGITVNLPQGTEFGFYLEVWEPIKSGDNNGYPEMRDGCYLHHRVYSEESMNEWAIANPQESEYGWKFGWSGKNAQQGYSFGSSFVTTVNGKNYTFFGFEDWGIAGPDLNDAIFMFEDVDNPVVVEKDPANKWIIACEDLGQIGDFDFNDLVFGVTYVSGREVAQVTPLASGGTYPIWLWYTAPDGTKTQLCEEFHSIFGAATTEPVNVGKNVNGRWGGVYTIPVPNTFSLSCVDNPGHGTLDNMGGFFVKVKRPDGDWGEVTAPMRGDAPQMILIQAVTETNDENGEDTEPYYWRWLRESQHITIAYPEFGEWGANYHNHTWHKHIENESVLMPKYDF